MNGTDYRSDIAIDDLIVLDKQPVGMDETIEDNLTLAVFPNPANDQITLRSGIEEPTVLIIHDALGREVYTTSVNKPISNVDISMLEAGVYYLSLVSDQSRESIKFIKQ